VMRNQETALDDLGCLREVDATKSRARKSFLWCGEISTKTVDTVPALQAGLESAKRSNLEMHQHRYRTGSRAGCDGR